MELTQLYSRIMPEFQPESPYFRKENFLSLALAKPERGKQPLQSSVSIYACNALGTLNTEDMSFSGGLNMQHQNLYRCVPSQSQASLDCCTSNRAGNLDSSKRTPQRLSSTHLHMGAGRAIICRDNIQDAAGSGEITPRSAKGGSCVSQQPLTHTFSVLKCEDTCRWECRIPASTNTQSAGTDNLPVKGLKYVPVLMTPMEANFEWSVSNKGNLCLNNSNGPILDKKRKSICFQKRKETDLARGLADQNPYFLKARYQQEGPDNCQSDGERGLADQNPYFLKARYQQEGPDNCQSDGERHYEKERQHEPIATPNHCSPSKYCFKKHKVFADKIEGGLQGLKTFNGIVELQSKNMQNLGWSQPQSRSLELNGNGVINSSVNVAQLCSLGDSGLGNMTTTLPLEGTNTELFSNQTDIRNTVELQSLNDNSFRTMGLRLGCLESAPPEPAASEKKTPCRISSSESDWGKFLALSASSENSQVDQLEKETLAPYQHRFVRLQAFLKQCDESDQYYFQSLWPLSASARSVHAVKLESRAIMLSLEEGKELHRTKMLDVLGKNFRGSSRDADAAAMLEFLVSNSF